MYSFAQRPDMIVLDEPLYGYYLSNVGIKHPGREEVLKIMEKNGEHVLKSLIQLTKGARHVFVKNMAHHYVNLPYEYLLKFSNIFIIKNNQLLTPYADSCLPGITRSVIFRLAAEIQISIKEKRLTMSEIYNADEIFVTGTMGEITPVLSVDGRRIAEGIKGVMTTQIQKLYKNLTQSEGYPQPF